MDAEGAIRLQLNLAHMTTKMLLDGLSDADLPVRIAPAANHAAWQLGHLISSERGLVETVTCRQHP